MEEATYLYAWLMLCALVGCHKNEEKWREGQLATQLTVLSGFIP